MRLKRRIREMRAAAEGMMSSAANLRPSSLFLSMQLARPCSLLPQKAILTVGGCGGFNKWSLRLLHRRCDLFKNIHKLR